MRTKFLTADGPTCTAAATEFVSKGVELGDRNSCATLNCPATHVCQMGAFFADCCPKTGEGECVT